VLQQLEDGGAILVASDGGEALPGVLTRATGMISDAEVAQPIESGRVPPLEELLARDDGGELL
jgi:hypothetical protein